MEECDDVRWMNRLIWGRFKLPLCTLTLFFLHVLDFSCTPIEVVCAASSARPSAGATARWFAGCPRLAMPPSPVTSLRFREQRRCYPLRTRAPKLPNKPQTLQTATQSLFTPAGNIVSVIRTEVDEWDASLSTPSSVTCLHLFRFCLCLCLLRWKVKHTDIPSTHSGCVGTTGDSGFSRMTCFPVTWRRIRTHVLSYKRHVVRFVPEHLDKWVEPSDGPGSGFDFYVEPSTCDWITQDTR